MFNVYRSIRIFILTCLLIVLTGINTIVLPIANAQSPVDVPMTSGDDGFQTLNAIGDMSTANQTSMVTEDSNVSTNVDGIDEMVVVGTDGYIYAYNFEGTQIFKSPESGWTLVTTADFNGDGDDEIVAVGGNSIKVYDPQVVGTAYTFTFNATFSDGNSFTAVDTGDFSNDSSLDIALLRSYGGTASHIIVYDLPNTTPAQNASFTLADWDSMAVGDYDGDGDDDFALTYWNDSYSTNSKSWFEIYQGDNLAQKIVGHYSDSVWFDIASGNFDTGNGNQMEWVGSQNLSPNLAVQKLSGSSISNIWSLGMAFNFVATADFRGEGDDQVAMLRNVGSGVSLQFAKNSTVWSSLSGLGSGWLNLSAGNLDSEATYREAVAITANLIRVFLQPQAGSGGSSTYLDCNTVGNCFDIIPVAALNGALAVGDLGSYSNIDFGSKRIYLPLVLKNYINYFEGPWEVEPNDGPAAGEPANGPIISGVTYSGQLPAGDEKDYFYVYLTEPHTIEIWLTDIPSGQDYNLLLRDANDLNNILGYSGTLSNEDEHIISDVLSPGKYYIQVYQYSAGSSGVYHLGVVY